MAPPRNNSCPRQGAADSRGGKILQNENDLRLSSADQS